jgi:hypothetical protein
MREPRPLRTDFDATSDGVLIGESALEVDDIWGGRSDGTAYAEAVPSLSRRGERGHRWIQPCRRLARLGGAMIVRCVVARVIATYIS